MSDQLTHTPSDILRWLLIDLSTGTDPDDDGSWPIYCNRETETPDNLVVLRDTSGRLDGFHQVDGDAIEFHGIQVTVRSKDHNVGYRKADEIKRAFDNSIVNSTITTPSGVTSQTYTVHAVTRTGDIIPLPTAGSGRRRFTINAVIRLTQS